MTNNIRKYRNQLKYTLDDLSRMTGLSAGYLSHLERGSRNNPSMKSMLKISVALNKSFSEIFNED